MQGIQFTCPGCNAALRVKDRRFVGRQVDCPDCGQAFLILADGHRGLTAQAVDNAETANEGLGAQSAGTSDATRDAMQRASTSSRTESLAPLWSALKSPVGVAWSVAGLVGLVMAALLVFPGDGEGTQGPQASSVQAVADSDTEERSRQPAAVEEATWKQAGRSENPRGINPPAEHVDPAPQQAAGALLAGPDELPEPPAGPSQPLANIAPPDGGLFAAVGDGDVSQPVVAPQPSPAPAPLAEDDQPRDDERTSPPAPAAPQLTAAEISAALDQPILSFQQSRAVPVRDLLAQLEEMAGVTVSVDASLLDAEAARLDERIGLQQHNTTVGGLLTELLKRVGWTYEIRDGRIHVVPGS